MAQSLTGKKIKDTYDGLLKMEDNQGVGSTLKRLTDGLGNFIPIEINTNTVKITGTLDLSESSVTGGPIGPTGATGSDGLQGATGPDGLSFNWKGDWEPGVTYSVNDTVYYEGTQSIDAGSYICIQETDSEEFDFPDSWDLMVKGVSGDFTLPKFIAYSDVTEGYAVRLNESGEVLALDYTELGEDFTTLPIIGIAQQSVLANEEVEVAVEGSISKSHTGLQPGFNYYTDTDGSLSLNGVNLMGIALSETELNVGFSRASGKSVPSASILDNTISDPDLITIIGRYIVPESGLTGSFVDEENNYANFDGDDFTFTEPNEGDKVSITTGPNAGNVYNYISGVWELSAQVTSLPTSNWALGGSYKQGDLVIYQNAIYQANDDIPSNTVFVTGTTGATWRQIGISGQSVFASYEASSFSGNRVAVTQLSSVGGISLADSNREFVIPSDGVYKLYAFLGIRTTNTAYRWADNTGVILPGTNDGFSISANSTDPGAPASAGGYVSLTAGQRIRLTFDSGADSFPMLSNITIEKISGFLPVTGPVLISQSLNITATTTSPDISGATFVRNLFNLVDDGSGWCNVDINFEKNVGGSAGSGDYLVNLPTGYQFDFNFHGFRQDVGDPGNAGLFNWIPASGLIANTTQRQNVYVIPWDATRFRIVVGREEIFGQTLTPRTPWASGFFTLSDFTSLQLSFRFKKV